MKSVFVTGTDTDVGKTIIVGLLARYLRDQGHRIVTQKWVQTGTRDYPRDLDTHLQLMGANDEIVRGHERDVNPYAFTLAASPHLAAAHENARIETPRIIESFHRLKTAFDAVIVEGAGGILVPLNDRELFVDVVADLQLPVLVVAANKLGTINHTLLTIEALKARDIETLGIVFNTTDPNQDETIVRDNPQIVEAFARVPILGQLPWATDAQQLYESFKPIARSIATRLMRT